MSIRMPRSVFISEMLSAPSASTAFAISVMLVTFGVSLTISGLLVAALTAFVTEEAPSQVTPQVAPPALTFGQEMFSSIMSTSVESSASAAAM